MADQFVLGYDNGWEFDLDTAVVRVCRACRRERSLNNQLRGQAERVPYREPETAAGYEGLYAKILLEAELHAEDCLVPLARAAGTEVEEED